MGKMRVRDRLRSTKYEVLLGGSTHMQLFNPNEPSALGSPPLRCTGTAVTESRWGWIIVPSPPPTKASPTISMCDGCMRAENMEQLAELLQAAR